MISLTLILILILQYTPLHYGIQDQTNSKEGGRKIFVVITGEKVVFIYTLFWGSMPCVYFKAFTTERVDQCFSIKLLDKSYCLDL